MDKPNAVFSTSIKSGKRCFFLDVRTASNNTNYLIISELSTDKDGNKKRQSIMLFSNEFNKMLQEFLTLEQYFPEQERREAGPGDGCEDQGQPI